MVCVQLEPKRRGEGGLGYPGRRGVENKLRTPGEQRLRESMSADREEVNEWELQKENKTHFRMCDHVEYGVFPAAAAWSSGGHKPVRLY